MLPVKKVSGDSLALRFAPDFYFMVMEENELLIFNVVFVYLCSLLALLFILIYVSYIISGEILPFLSLVRTS